MFTDLQTKAKELVVENASAILTAGGVIGTVATAVFAGRAGFKAARIIDEEMRNRVELYKEDKELSAKEKILLVGPQFILPVATGAATVTAIVFANRISAQRAAALAAAYSLSATRFEEYRAKVQEKLSHHQAQDIQDETQQDRINKRPPQDNVIIVGTGPVLCYDAFSDRYFKATAEKIRRAEQVVNGEINTGNECRLGIFYNELELPETMFDDMLGWNLENQCKIVLSPMMINDADACLCIEFVNLPRPNYGVEY